MPAALGLTSGSLRILAAGRRFTTRWIHISLSVLFLSFAGGQLAAQETIGTVNRIQGAASATRGGATRPLGLNASVAHNETISTGPAARVEVVFKDDTRLTLGENAKLTLDRYVFDPAGGRGSLRFKAVGAFRFLSGQLSKLARSDVTVATPIATIGIRGTEFWGGPIDGQPLGVFLIDGAVRVSNARGSRILNRSGQGTNIPRVGAAPGPVTFWPQDKVNRAIATVAFQ